MKAILLGCGALAAKNRSYSSLLVQTRTRLFLFDCGASPVQRVMEAGSEPLTLDALFLTHHHTDHLYSLPILIHELRLRGREMPIGIFFPEPAQQKVEKVIETFFTGEPNLPKLNLNRVKLESETLVFEEDGLKVLSSPVEHSIPALAYKVVEERKSLVYAPDTVPCEQLVRFAENATMLLHDATYLNDEEKARRAGHSTVAGALKDARLARVEKLVLIHLGPEVGVRKLSGFSGEVVWGRDMLTLEI